MTRVLLIGDSMAGGLKGPLGSLVPGLSTVYQDSTFTAQWAGNGYAAGLINRYQPDALLVALGTNDISMPRPTSETASAARQIVAAAGGRRVLWIGPPSGPSFIGRDRGTIAAIQGSGAEYFDSRQLLLSFYDGIHPSPAGFQTWARAIASRVGSGSGSGLGLPVTGIDLTQLTFNPSYGYLPPPPQSFDLFNDTPPEFPATSSSNSKLLLVAALAFLLLW